MLIVYPDSRVKQNYPIAKAIGQFNGGHTWSLQGQQVRNSTGVVASSCRATAQFREHVVIVTQKLLHADHQSGLWLVFKYQALKDD